MCYNGSSISKGDVGMIKARVIEAGTQNYYKVGVIKNCYLDNMGYHYLLRINNKLVMYHESQIEIL